MKTQQKLYYWQYNIGRSKYCINFFDGINFHKDGSPFYGIYLTNSMAKAKKHERELIKQGYKER